MLMADETWGMHANCGNGAPPTGEVTPPVDGHDNHAAAGRNAVFTDGHVEWINGGPVNSYFQEAQKDYDDMSAAAGVPINFETTD